MEDLKEMTLGEIVDFVIDYNERNKDEEEEKPTRRKATQRDIDAFFG